MPRTPRSLLITAAAAACAGLCPGIAAASTAATASATTAPHYVPGEVIVRYADKADAATAEAIQDKTGTGDQDTFAPGAGVVQIEDGESVAETVAELEQRPGVISASPNWIAYAAGFDFNDPGRLKAPGGWKALQWNLLAGEGIDAPTAWENVARAGRRGGSGVVVAVLDSGVAYRDKGPFRRSPDISPKRIVAGYDFVDDDPYPLDDNGHGTHVASTIVESANNAIGVTGIAYRARVMPVRVLNNRGEGDSAAIAAGIRYAARRGAHVINLSVEFDRSVRRTDIPDILAALRYARRRGSLVIAASGNTGLKPVAYPARAGSVLSVGATTEHGCLADYSNRGTDLDIVAPGGGPDANLPRERDRCRPLDPPGRDIYQMTFLRSIRSFGLPSGYNGTSMAAPHVSATAALVIASGVLGADPTPRALEDHLKATSTDLGPVGPDTLYGAGRVNAGAATTPR